LKLKFAYKHQRLSPHKNAVPAAPHFYTTDHKYEQSGK